MSRRSRFPVFTPVSSIAKVNVKVYVFYADLLYKIYPFLMHEDLLDLPDGCYLYVEHMKERKWYRKDLTPVLDEHVPPTLKMLVLVLGAR